MRLDPHEGMEVCINCGLVLAERVGADPNVTSLPEPLGWGLFGESLAGLQSRLHLEGNRELAGLCSTVARELVGGNSTLARRLPCITGERFRACVAFIFWESCKRCRVWLSPRIIADYMCTSMQRLAEVEKDFRGAALPPRSGLWVEDSDGDSEDGGQGDLPHNYAERIVSNMGLDYPIVFMVRNLTSLVEDLYYGRKNHIVVGSILLYLFRHHRSLLDTRHRWTHEVCFLRALCEAMDEPCNWTTVRNMCKKLPGEILEEHLLVYI